MAEWAVCPGCHLKHSRRPDGLCPRCRQPLDAAEVPATTDASATSDVHAAADAVNPYQSPTRLDDPVQPAAGRSSLLGLREYETAPEPETMSTAARIAGGIFLINAFLVLVEKMVIKGESGPFSSPISVIIDVVVGGMLVAGRQQILPLAKFRTVAGGIVLPIVHVVQGNILLAVIQIFFSGSISLLLFGRAGGLRLGAGLAGAGLCVGLEVIGLSAVTLGFNPLASLMAGLESEPVTVVRGVRANYQITAPASGWYLRKADVAQKENPLADRWLMRPDLDAHVLIIAEELPAGSVADMDRFAEVVLGNFRQSGNEIKLLTQQDLSPVIRSRLLHAQARSNGLPMEMLFGLYAEGSRIYQVVAFAPQARFGDASGDLRQIISSFTLL